MSLKNYYSAIAFWLCQILLIREAASEERYPGNDTFLADELRIPLCPCTNGEECDTNFNILMLPSAQSREWFIVPSESIPNKTVEVIHCRNQLKLVLDEFSYAFLPNGDLFHVHGNMTVDSSSYCIRRSFNENYALGGSNESPGYMKIEADTCITPPMMRYCCPEGGTLKLEKGVAECISDSATRTNPNIVFDGKTHDWYLNGSVEGPPDCDPQTSEHILVALNQAEGSASLHLKGSDLQFRWKSENNLVIMDQNEICVGQQKADYRYTTVAVICQKKQRPINTCDSDLECHAKCCPDDEIYDLNSKKCISEIFIYTWHSELFNGKSNVMYGMPSCKSYFSANQDEDQLMIFPNGSLLIGTTNALYSAPNYCFDHFRNQTHIIPMALVCFNAERYSAYDLSTFRIVFIVFLMLSSAQLAAAIFFMNVYVAPSLTSCSNIDESAASPLTGDTNPEEKKADFFILFLSTFLLSCALECFTLGLQQIFSHTQIAVTACKLLGNFVITTFYI